MSKTTYGTKYLVVFIVSEGGFVTFPMLWRDTITKAAYKRKSLLGTYSFDKLMTIMIGNMTVDRHGPGIVAGPQKEKG